MKKLYLFSAVFLFALICQAQTETNAITTPVNIAEKGEIASLFSSVSKDKDCPSNSFGIDYQNYKTTWALDANLEFCNFCFDLSMCELGNDSDMNSWSFSTGMYYRWFVRKGLYVEGRVMAGLRSLSDASKVQSEGTYGVLALSPRIGVKLPNTHIGIVVGYKKEIGRFSQFHDSFSIGVAYHF